MLTPLLRRVVASCPRRQRAARLHESIAQTVPGRSLQAIVALFNVQHTRCHEISNRGHLMSLFASYFYYSILSITAVSTVTKTYCIVIFVMLSNAEVIGRSIPQL